MPVFADVDNDGIQEVVAGRTVYRVTIDRADPSKNSVTFLNKTIPIPGYSVPFPVDGFTSVADIDLDGDLDVIVTGGHPLEKDKAIVYVWDGATNAQIGNTLVLNSTDKRISRAFAGDIDGDKCPDIAFTYTKQIEAYSYNAAANRFDLLFSKPTTDASGATTMSMFDFNQDDTVELVYRDESHLRIINQYGQDIQAIECASGTHTEYPVIVDLDRDGHADILVSGGETKEGVIYLHRFGSKTPDQWASARSVWNQHAYNATNINSDLSIPRYPLNPATVFPGPDGKLAPPPSNDNDNVRPYNAFLQQQTMINRNGIPIWLTPDAVFDPSQTTTSVEGDSVWIRFCIVNQGASALGNPVYATLYYDSIKPNHIISTDSINGYIMPGDTACLTIGVPDIKPYLPFVQLIVRLNDRNGVYPFQKECECGDSIQARINPARNLMMHKDATLNGVQLNGRYTNPVSVLFRDTIVYEIRGVFVNTEKGRMIIHDTLPPYMKYAGDAFGQPSADVCIEIDSTSDTPSRDLIRWTFKNVYPLESRSAEYRATPVSGACASQPLYINYAWVNALVTGGDTVFSRTNSTYHQGAGVSIITFSASVGGQLFNAREQALDYRTSPRAGVLIVPDSGYTFAGWSHGEYISLCGKKIAADSGIMNYDSLVIYGNVELRAHFAPVGKPAENGIGQEMVVDNSNKVWSYNRDIYIRTRKGAFIRIYSTEGMLQRQLTIADDGITTVRMERGVYVVTVDDGWGWKVAVE
jgi:hypothetical protein